MQQDQVEIIERKLAEDRGTYYRGTARVRLEHLHSGTQCSRELDRKIVENLKDKFTTEGCLRLEPKHHVPALIDQQTLDLAIESSPEASIQTLLDNPKDLPPELKIAPGCSLECLHGRHRLQAARETLRPKDKWWTVDLYLRDASSDLKKALSEEYSNSINFSDGEIFQKIRRYQSRANKSPKIMFAEKRWWARLSKSKRKDLKQLLKHEGFTMAFDALLAIPGIWVGLRIGMLHKLIAMKCDEELLHYLGHILAVWSQILGGNRELMRITDRATVEALQLRAPRYSPEDLTALEPLFRDGEIFPHVRNQQDRRNIWKNLQEVRGLIPSMYSFFEDCKYLNPPAKILKHLIGKTKLTVRQAMEQMFSGRNQTADEFITQQSEKSFRSDPGTLNHQVEFGYQQMWLYAWRHFTELIEECPRKEDGQPTPVPQEPDKVMWYNFAALADKLGFESEHIDRLKTLNPDREVARKALLMARDPRYFKYNEAALERFQDQMVDMFRTAVDVPPTYIKPPLLVDGPGEALQRRCGRTFQIAYENDRDFIFLDVLYDPRSGEGKGISSFFVRTSVYFAFFGRLQDNSAVNPPSTPQPEEPAPRAGTRNQTPPHSPREEPQPQGSGSSNGSLQSIPITQASSPVGGQMALVPASNETTGEASNAVAHREDQRASEEPDDQAMPLLHRRIFVQVWQNGVLEDQRTSLSMDQSEVERFATKQIRKDMFLFNTLGRALTPKNCFDAIINDGAQTLIIVPGSQLDISRQLVASTEQSGANALLSEDEGRRKRRLITNG